jgi:phage gp29-like protein
MATKIESYTKNPEKVTVVNNEIRVLNLPRTKVEVAHWRAALTEAEQVHAPIRMSLYQVYQEIWLDAHLHAVIQKRIRNVKNKKIVFRSKNGEINEGINKPLHSLWFVNMIKYIMESVFWGHSIIEFKTEGYNIKDVCLVPRHMVRPEFGIVCKQSPTDRDGIRYREDQMVRQYTFEVDFGLGLMNIAAANAIFAKFGKIDYSNFVELFGSPILEARYDPAYPNAKADTKKAFDEMGNSSKIYLPKDSSSLTVHKGADGNSGDLHGRFLEMLKKELTILVLGQTMTTDDGSSRSQAEVHQDEQNEVTREDMMMVSFVLNEIVLPKLVGLGLNLGEGTFEFLEEKKINLKDRIDIDLKLTGIIDISEDYFYDTYGIPKPKPNDIMAGNRASTSLEDTNDEKKKNLKTATENTPKES